MQPQDFQTVLIAVNAQYIHTGLGVRSIAAYVRRESENPMDIMEFTINNPEQDILSALVARNADAYLFSCYIWNIEIVLRLVRNLRQLLPTVFIGLGGPQVSYQAESVLRGEPAIDVIVTGEGETTVCQLIELLKTQSSLHNCAGLVRRDGDQFVATPPRKPITMDALPFAYPDLDTLENRIIYYESMRGCPFSCSYCSSSIEHGVRTRSFTQVVDDLSIFLAHRVPQVKFVDRTFNCDKAHAMAIWQWLAEHDNGITNFHFELSGELLDDEMLAFLAGVRPQLFQFEIGVQSTHLPTLREIDRPANIADLFHRIERVLRPGNIHVHLDLIAGLPLEDFDRFQISFNDVYAYHPHQFQLGFLKVLPGSKMQQEAPRYGLLYSCSAPYEVLQTAWLSYPQITLLHGVAYMVNVYYNSFRFQNILNHIVPLFQSPFAFYHALWLHYQLVTQGKPLSDMGYYSLMESFIRAQDLPVTEKMQWLAKFDLLLHEKPHKVPAWITVDDTRAYRNPIQRFFMRTENIARYLPEYAAEPSTRVERTAHLEIFPFNPLSGADERTAVLFNYRRRSIVGVADTTVLPWDMFSSQDASFS